jgi:tRNA modification GTPase
MSDPRPPTADFCLLTPPGRGAIATIGVRGAGAIALVGRHFRPTSGKELTEISVGRAVFGRFHFAATPTRSVSEGATSTRSVSESNGLSISEDLVVGLIAPKEVEINCHGGNAAAEAICDALSAAGSVRVTAEQWALAQQADRLSAEALVALASARTERTAAILLDQYRGALRRAVATGDQALRGGDCAAASAALQRLLALADVGRHLTQPWKVVIAGAPNAGKSSLMNAVLGYERSIVWHEPGTTRDVLSAGTAIDGWPVELFDTAGLRDAADELEAEGVARAASELRQADVVLFVAETPSAWDHALFSQVVGAARRAPLVVHNKCDLAGPPDDGRPAGIETSATSGAGIDTLCRAITQAIVPRRPPPGAAVPFTQGQFDALHCAAQALANGDAPAARECLLPLLLDYNAAS